MRALISVFDKSGIAELAASLHDLGVELVSSGGTAEVIAAAGIEVTDVAEFTGAPPMLGHRVVTLHPKLHGAILADRRDPSHLTDVENYGIELIDMVVGNLYPFSSDPSIELIDIGGPAMMRAAAKNHDYVTVLVDPADYDGVLAEIKESGATSPSTRRRLARKAFSHCATYDAAIVEWFDEEDRRLSPPKNGDQLAKSLLPPSVHLSLERVGEPLRYGENPHQQGARYRQSNQASWLDGITQHSGLDPSYLNIVDADFAWRLVHDLCHDALDERPAVVIVKHANPCGVSVADDLATAYSQAFQCDSNSAFGGIVALNQTVDLATASAMIDAAQADVIIAPGYEDGVIDQLIAKRKNTRIMTASARPISNQFTLRQLSDSFLMQEAQALAAAPESWQVVSKARPSVEAFADAAFAWRVCAHVSSNAIVLAKDTTAWGIGAGQQNRVASSQIAAEKAAGRAAGGACASDAFYPFPDGIDAAAAAGVSVVVQPGGSVNDDKVIAAADGHGLAMIFTQERQFRH